MAEGDDLVQIVTDSVLAAARAEGFTLRNRDVVGITESLLARAQGNYVTIEAVTEELNRVFTDDFAVVFPMLSRNRFAPIMQGIVGTGRRIYLYLSYPADEVGNHLMDIETMYKTNINPYRDVLTEAQYRDIFGEHVPHQFTGVDYVQMYKNMAAAGQMEIYLTNDLCEALRKTRHVLVANVHERQRTKHMLQQAGAETVYSLDDLFATPRRDGYNPEYGLLGANEGGNERIKLFPRDSQQFVEDVQKALYEATGKTIEVLVYGDGAFKDPVGRIWELADPVVSPGFTSGLQGQPNEVKLKYIADNDLADVPVEERERMLRDRIRAKNETTAVGDEAMGTTPRRVTDVLGSLCDLTSGSGDKGTPIVLVQGYFDSYADEA